MIAGRSVYLGHSGAFGAMSSRGETNGASGWPDPHSGSGAMLDGWNANGSWAGVYRERVVVSGGTCCADEIQGPG